MRRYDYFQLKAEKTDEGFIRDKPIVARSGLLRYMNADGSTRIEYRPPNEAFDADSLASIKGKPITLGHPQSMVSFENAGQMPIIGSAISEGYRDGEAIRADIMLYQLPTNARELSLGYTLDLDETPGTTPDGQHYDAIQRNVRVNHIAVVPRGRAGIARLNMDGEEIYEENMEKEAEKMAEKMVKIRLDSGIEYECAEEVKIELEKVRKDFEDSKAELDKSQAKIDSLEAELSKEQEGRKADAEKAKENFDEAVKSRIELLKVAEAHKVENADSMTDAEIKVSVIKAVRGDAINLEGKSNDYIDAAFDMAKADIKQHEDGIAQQREEVGKRNDEAKNDVDDVASAYEKLKNAEAEMYKGGK